MSCCEFCGEDDDVCECVCPNCGESGEDRGDFCACVDCGTELCSNCAVNQRCDSCDCDCEIDQ